MKLFVVRHGQSEANLGMRYTGQFDTPLTDLGREQATAIRPVLAQYTFDKVYSSDLSRAAETCALALPGSHPEYTKLLREYDVGDLVGKIWDSVPPFQPEDPTLRPDYTSHGGENVAMMCERVKQFLTEVENCGAEYVAAFSHFGFLRGLLSVVLGAAFDNRTLIIDNCAIFVFEHDGTRWRVAALNYMKQIP